MADTPWLDDACSLVEAFRSGERSPVEELEATLAAIEASDLNAFSFLDPERALDAARSADVSKPFGGVPIGVKELDQVQGWPDTGASLVFADRIADHTGEAPRRFIEEGGAVPVGLTAASEFGGLNVSVTKLNGVTHNPWQHGRTCGGSSGGSASAVVGGLVSIATAGDGGGSIRIPAGYTGLFGMKGTYGRISRGPEAYFRPGTVVPGVMARSVRDAARHYDVVAGVDHRDPTTLPSEGGWEAALGTVDLRGKRVGILPTIAGVRLEDGVEAQLRQAAGDLATLTGMEVVDVSLQLPNLAAQWAMGNLSTLLAELGGRWRGALRS
jgi:Asp-tRNA(Asn)/Glu-tRNA(Gln) amidotransferase A subunit family amidase